MPWLRGVYRVIQWATGNTGQRAFRELIQDPSYDVVGVRVYDEAKDGADAGELCGQDATGVAATTDRGAILKLKADCCVYMARATGTGQTRAGLTQDELADDMVALLERGTNVVTTCTDLIAGGVRLTEANRTRILNACIPEMPRYGRVGAIPGSSLRPSRWRSSPSSVGST